MQLFILILVYVFVIWMFSAIILRCRKDIDEKRKFDERQYILRNKGRQLSYLFLMLYIFFFVTIFPDDLFSQIEPKLVIAIGATCSFTLYIAYTIWNDVYFALNEKNKNDGMSAFGIAVIFSVVAGIFELCFNKEIIYSQGELKIGFIIFICTFEALVLFIVSCIKQHSRKKQHESNTTSKISNLSEGDE